MGISIIRKMRRQKAVYWGTPSSDGYGGKQVIKPIELSCRWEDGNTQIRTPSGEEITATATVYVDQDVSIGGFLYLGTLQDLIDAGINDYSVQDITSAREIMKFDKLPILRVRQDGLDPNADEYLRTAWL